MTLHPILPPEVAAADLHGKACRCSLDVSRRSGTHFPQLLYLRAIPKEMPLLPVEVVDLGPGLFVCLFHLFQLLGLRSALLLQIL